MLADAGIVDILSAFNIKQRQHVVLNDDISFDAFSVAGFRNQFPAGARMILMLDIVLRAFDRISEHLMGVDDFAEAGQIAGVLIVGMVAQRKMTEYSFYRFRVGVRTRAC